MQTLPSRNLESDGGVTPSVLESLSDPYKESTVFQRASTLRGKHSP